MLRELLCIWPVYLVRSVILFCCVFSVFAQPVPERADIAKIYNIEREANQKVDVRFFRKEECSTQEWCRITGEGEYLKADDWLQTGEVSRADLALMYNRDRYRKVLFWQQRGSRSKFEPKEGTCHFRIDQGGFLYAHPNQSSDAGCDKIASKDALIFLSGTALFVIGSRKGTLVGILSNHPKRLIKVQHRNSGKTAELSAGFYAETLPNGDIRQGQFDLEDFYKNHPLALGLGPDSEDEAYVARQVLEIQKILKEIRKETVSALEKQKRSRLSGTFDPTDWIGSRGGNQPDPDNGTRIPDPPVTGGPGILRTVPPPTPPK